MSKRTDLAFALGTEHGTEHAQSLYNDFYVIGDGFNNPNASDDNLLKLLEKCAQESHDWGNSSSEAFAMIHGDHDLPDTAAVRDVYCEAYEDAARIECARLAAEMRAARG